MEVRVAGRPGLVRTFALRSLVLTAVFVIVLSVLVAWLLWDAVVAESNRVVSVPLVATIHRVLPSESSFDGTLTAEKVLELDADLRSELVGEDIVALKIWNRRSQVLYSTDREEIGRRFPADDSLSAALGGRAKSNFTEDEDEENEPQVRRYGALFETYFPVRAESGEVVGAYEVYRRLQPIRDTAATSVLVIVLFVMFSGATMYVAQIQIIRRAEQRLSVSEEEVEKVNGRLESSLRDLEEHTLGTLQALTSAVDAKDSYTAKHSLGTTDYASAIGRQLGLSKGEMRTLERAGLLHDIGKIGVPEQILLNPGRLTEEEFAAVKEHSEIGAQIVESIPFLRDVVPVIRHHHEHWNGKGYPAGLSGKDIPRLARVLSVADAYDAMTSDRPYRAGLKWFRARQELRRWRGVQFDPEAVDALLNALKAEEPAKYAAVEDDHEA
jgi:putative nucleotidyltransferase with HDIG domain